MPEEEKIYDSGTPEIDDDFWLEQGKKLVEGSFEAVIKAAETIATGIGLLQGIYLAIIGFAEGVTKSFSGPYKALLIIPFLFWMLGLYTSIQVIMTKREEINLHSPDDIQNKFNKLLKNKQNNIMWSYWSLTAGMLIALVLLIFPFV